MAAPTFKKSKVKQTINLKDEFGVDFRGMNSLKEAIGGAIIERIRDRSKQGDGISFGAGGAGRQVKLKSPYSKEYSDSLDFKAFGKSRGNVNMTLTGDMLGLMDVIQIDGNSITIGWNDAEENAKAFNHSVGDTVPRRPFFGVSKKELQDIKKKFGDEIRNAVKARNEEGRQAFERRVAGLLELIGGSDGESET